MIKPDQPLRVDHLQQDLMGRSVRGGAITLGAQAFKVVVQLGAVIVLSRLLAPQAFGLVAMVAAVTEILDQFKDFGLSTVTIQKPDISHAQVTALFWINAAIGACLAAALAAAGPAIAAFYGQEVLADIARWLALGFVVSGLTTQHWAILRRQMRFSTIATIDVGSELIAMAVAVAAALAGAGFWALVGQRLTYTCLVMLGTWCASGWRPGLPRRTPDMAALLAFGGSVTGNGIVSLLARNLDQVLIGWYWGPRLLGLYERAYKLFMVPINNVTVPIYSVGMPALSRLCGNPARYHRAYFELSEKLAMLTMPAAALIAATADWVVAVLLGPQWSASAPIVAWLGFAAVSLPVGVVTGILFVSQDRAGDLLKAGLIGAAISAGSILLGLPFGPVGVACTFALGSTFLRIPMWFWLAGRKGPVTTADLYQSVLPSLAAACAVFTATQLFRISLAINRLAPLTALALSIAIAIVAALLSFIALPRSRRAIFSLQDLSRIMFWRKAST